MAGRPGRSGGWNKLSLEEHRQRGTLRPGRHLGKKAALARLEVATVERTEPIRAGLIEGLTGPGRDFVETCWADYRGWSPASLVLLHEAGRLMDELETLRGQKGERAAQRLLLSTLAALRLDEP